MQEGTSHGSRSYVGGSTDTVPHGITGMLAAGQIAAGQDALSVAVVGPDAGSLATSQWVASRDGCAFAGKAEGMEVCAGEVTLRLPGSRARELALRSLRGAGQRWGFSHAVIKDHLPPADLVVLGR